MADVDEFSYDLDGEDVLQARPASAQVSAPVTAPIVLLPDAQTAASHPGGAAASASAMSAPVAHILGRGAGDALASVRSSLAKAAEAGRQETARELEARVMASIASRVQADKEDALSAQQRSAAADAPQAQASAASDPDRGGVSGKGAGGAPAPPSLQHGLGTLVEGQGEEEEEDNDENEGAAAAARAPPRPGPAIAPAAAAPPPSSAGASIAAPPTPPPAVAGAADAPTAPPSGGSLELLPSSLQSALPTAAALPASAAAIVASSGDTAVLLGPSTEAEFDAAAAETQAALAAAAQPSAAAAAPSADADATVVLVEDADEADARDGSFYESVEGHLLDARRLAPCLADIVPSAPDPALGCLGRWWAERLSPRLLPARDAVFGLAKMAYAPEDGVHARLFRGLFRSITGLSFGGAGEGADAWTTIGFQRAGDFSTDLRGGGMLGPLQALWLARRYPPLCRRLQAAATHPVRSFPLMLTSISLTGRVAMTALRMGRLAALCNADAAAAAAAATSTNASNSSNAAPALAVVLRATNDFFCAAVAAFLDRWEATGASLADYGRILLEVEREVGRDCLATVRAFRAAQGPKAQASAAASAAAAAASGTRVPGKRK